MMRVKKNKNGMLSKAGQHLEQPGLMEAVSVHSKGLEQDYI